MKKSLRSIALLLALLALFAAGPSALAAQLPETAAALEVEVAPMEETFLAENGTPQLYLSGTFDAGADASAPLPADNQALFEGYAQSVFFGGGAAPQGVLDKSSQLGAVNRAMAAAMKTEIKKVAAGERSSTVFTVSFSQLGVTKTSWTAAELGVSSLTSGSYISDAAMSAIEAIIGYDPVAVVNALLADCPYELFWYDKTAGFYYSANSYVSDGSSIWLENDGYRIEMAVAGAYAAGNFTTDAAAIRSVQTAAANAKKIAAAYASASDYEKLVGYRREICDLVSYNSYAAENAIAYGDPWQLIWVFDGDAETNVVCEGYAKAFQYLCDLTNFSGSVTCYTVTGTMNGGNHMWNLVDMGGTPYLVDVTNCDAGAVGAEDLLFLRGASAGSWDTYYVFRCRGFEIAYRYDSATRATFTVSELSLSLADYDPAGGAGEQPLSGWQKIGRNWYYYKDGAPLTGWRKLSGKWYYFDDSGVMQTGWVKSSGKWYYFNKSGVMQTGFVTIGAKTYYFKSSGIMATGWVQVSGKWYYMSSSGIMQTGWRQIDGKWYFLNSAGVMQTGWLKSAGKWYYLGASGAMQTGWMKKSGYWYWFDAAGVMAVNTTKTIGGKTYTFDKNGHLVG